MSGCAIEDSYTSNMDAGEANTKEVEEAQVNGIENYDKLVKIVADRRVVLETPTSPGSSTFKEVASEFKEAAAVAMNNFSEVIPLLDKPRIGHARFRKGPVPSPSTSPAAAPRFATSSKWQRVQSSVSHSLAHRGIQKKPTAASAFKVYCPKPVLRSPSLPKSHDQVDQTNSLQKQLNNVGTVNPTSFAGGVLEKKGTGTAAPSDKDSSSLPVSASNSFISSITGETNMTHSQPPAFLAKSPLSKMCNAALKCRTPSEPCHCGRKRKLKTRKAIRVPAISHRNTEIPADAYTWRKYGQKLIKGSPYPRGYYRCSNVSGCPARKHVERDVDDSAMLIVTYEGNHNHPLMVGDAAPSLT